MRRYRVMHRRHSWPTWGTYGRPARALGLLVGAGMLVLAFRLATLPPPGPLRRPAAHDRFAAHRVEVNRATVAQLEYLPGIGPVLARRIVETRERRGPYLSEAELLEVPGLRRQWAACSAYVYCNPAQAREQLDRHRSEQARLPRTDLNRADSAALVERAGLPPRLARRLLNFRRACGGFDDWAHVGRTWDLTPRQLADLRAAFVLRPPPCLDLNRATAQDLERLRGIGPRRSQTIVRFREALGFFARPEQLAEVYGLPDSVYRQIRPRVCVEDAGLRRPYVEINRWDARQLARHPYLRPRSRAQSIVDWREAHGPFGSVDELRTRGLLDSLETERLRPYVVF